jgi:hypothetical protein
MENRTRKLIDRMSPDACGPPDWTFARSAGNSATSAGHCSPLLRRAPRRRPIVV